MFTTSFSKYLAVIHLRRCIGHMEVFRWACQTKKMINFHMLHLYLYRNISFSISHCCHFFTAGGLAIYLFISFTPINVSSFVFIDITSLTFVYHKIVCLKSKYSLISYCLIYILKISCVEVYLFQSTVIFTLYSYA